MLGKGCKDVFVPWSGHPSYRNLKIRAGEPGQKQMATLLFSTPRAPGPVLGTMQESKENFRGHQGSLGVSPGDEPPPQAPPASGRAFPFFSASTEVICLPEEA